MSASTDGSAPTEAGPQRRGSPLSAPTWKLATGQTRSGKALFECSGCGAQDPAPAKDHECRSKRLKLDPNLADGEHWTIHDKPNPVLLELLAAWFDEAQPGEAITLECVEMTDRQVEELPDI